jgi:ABC-type thiamine transport system substrate-binding protein
MNASRFTRTVLAVVLAFSVVAGAAAETVLTVLTHSSFSASKVVIAAFEVEAGCASSRVATPVKPWARPSSRRAIPLQT